MRSTILIAPDSFKGTFSATDVSQTIARGVNDANLRASLCPVADGGEGTLPILVAALDGTTHDVRTHDPLGREIYAPIGVLNDGALAIVEVATASGLGLCEPAERDAEAASSYGTGELIAAAVASGARQVIVALGGSATTDGGSGAITAINDAGGLGTATILALCDVSTSFERAAVVYAPQKGATPDAVRRLTARLNVQAEGLPRDPRGRPMTGAAGGLSGGLWAAFDAQLTPGAAWMLDTLGFDDRLGDVQAVITGEGRLDSQTFEGKIVGEISNRCRRSGVPLHAVVGSNALRPEEAKALGLASVTAAPTLAALERAGRDVSEALHP